MSPTGSQLAQNIEFLADSMADRAEFELSAQIRETSATRIGVSVDRIPQRLINSFSRGSTQVGKEQAIREIQLLLVGSNSDASATQKLFTEISNAVSDQRRQAHKLRSQLSSIRSLLKVLDPTRTSSIVQAMSPRHEEIRVALCDEKVDSVNRLQYWAEQVISLFEEVNRSSGSIDNTRIRKVRVSESAVRNYVAIFKTFVNRNANQILDSAIEQSLLNANIKVNPENIVQFKNIAADIELAIEIEDSGELPVSMTKRWNSISAAQAELTHWLETTKQLIGENTRVDSVKITKRSSTSEDSFNLKEVRIGEVEKLIKSLIS